MSTETAFVAGAAAGVAGGLAMPAFMTMAKRIGIIGTTLPVKVERRAAEEAGVQNRLTGIREEIAAQAGHLAFSAALGEVYGAARPVLRLRALPSGPVLVRACMRSTLACSAPSPASREAHGARKSRRPDGG